MDLAIVRIEPANLALLEAVDPDCFDEPIDLARAARCVASPDAALFVAVAGGVVVGQCLAAIHRHPDKPTELYLDDLAVSPTFQRRGIATRLVEACRAWARTHGAEELWVATEPDNAAATALYRALGLAPRTALVLEGPLEPRRDRADG
jgi:ribosomal protein S18 acetylase RimI-like enzyme